MNTAMGWRWPGGRREDGLAYFQGLACGWSAPVHPEDGEGKMDGEGKAAPQTRPCDFYISDSRWEEIAEQTTTTTSPPPEFKDPTSLLLAPRTEPQASTLKSKRIITLHPLNRMDEASKSQRTEGRSSRHSSSPRRLCRFSVTWSVRI